MNTIHLKLGRHFWPNKKIIQKWAQNNVSFFVWTEFSSEHLCNIIHVQFILPAVLMNCSILHVYSIDTASNCIRHHVNLGNTKTAKHNYTYPHLQSTNGWQNLYTIVSQWWWWRRWWHKFSEETPTLKSFSLLRSLA